MMNSLVYRNISFKYKSGYYWNEMPIETHTLMMDVFATIAKEDEIVQKMKKWLLNKKFKNNWRTTKATTAAIYALFKYDSDLLESSELIDISFNSQVAYQERLKKARNNAQKGTGYFKIDFKKFDQGMGSITLKNPNNIDAFGALYWQYFEDLDKVKSFKETPLVLEKRLYRQVNTPKGLNYEPLHQEIVKVGDRIKVRLKLKVQKAMEFVMLKDSRASAFEPLNVLSAYGYTGGLSYYQSTKDAATYFFIDYLPKGEFVLEYPMVVTHNGLFSNGISTAESMYAPEFKSHSKGVMVVVE